jgi:hypothetical protein
MKFFDWLNENPWLLLIGILLLCLRCSSTPVKADTLKYSNEVQIAKNDIDTAIDCKSQLDPDKCKQAIITIKKTLDKGITISEKKDNQIVAVQEKNESLEQDSKDLFWLRAKIGMFVLGIIVIILLYFFGGKILEIAMKSVKPV